MHQSRRSAPPPVGGVSSIRKSRIEILGPSTCDNRWMLLTVVTSTIEVTPHRGSQHPQIPVSKFNRLLPQALTDIEAQFPIAVLTLMVTAPPNDFSRLILNIFIGMYSRELYGDETCCDYLEGSNGVLYIVNKDNTPEDLRAGKYQVVSE